MGIEQIVSELRQERERIDKALRALEGLPRGNGRRRRGPGRRARRRFSAAARRKISEAAKARWAQAKKAGRNSL